MKPRGHRVAVRTLGIMQGIFFLDVGWCVCMWDISKYGLNLCSPVLFGRGRKVKGRKKEVKTEHWLFSKEELNQKEIFNLKNGKL